MVQMAFLFLDRVYFLNGSSDDIVWGVVGGSPLTFLNGLYSF